VTSECRKGRLDGWSVWHVWGIRDMPTGFRFENMKKRGYLEDLAVDGKLT
jgi:hypothetical protein